MEKEPIQPSDISIHHHEILGQGGFGIVYAGVFKNRKVAIKTCKLANHAFESQRMAMAAFVKEARKLIRIKHPRIVDRWVLSSN